MSCDHVTSQQSGAIFIKPWTDEDVWLEEQKKNLYHGAIEKFEYIWVQTYQPGMFLVFTERTQTLNFAVWPGA